jgi:hypothetical protein
MGPLYDLGDFVKGTNSDGSIWGFRIGLMMALVILAVIVLGLTTVLADRSDGPYLNVTAPAEDEMTNNESLWVIGVTEPTINVSIHVVGTLTDEWTNSTSESDGTFNITVDLFDGPQAVIVRSEDMDGNTTSILRNVTRDITPPSLEVWPEYLNTTDIPYNSAIEGYLTRDKEIGVNGSYDDDYSHDGEIIISVNGVDLYIFPSQWGWIWRRSQLDQGLNVFTYGARDRAGNTATMVINITYDSMPPILVLYNPVQGELTRNSTYLCSGLSDPNTTVELYVQSSSGTRSYTCTTGPDGTFDLELELYEGIQKVVISVKDPLGNTNQTFADMTLDTIPPDFIINQPRETYIVTRDTLITIVGTMVYDPNALIFIQIVGVGHTGVFQREVELEEGVNEIEVKAVDEAGNEKVVVLTVVRDTIAPLLVVTSPVSDTFFTNSATVRFRGTVSGASIVEIQHMAFRMAATLASGDWETGGTWEYGNEAIMTVLVVFDYVPPTIWVEEISDYINTTTLIIKGTTDTSIETVQISGEDHPVVNGVFEVNITLEDGDNTILIRVEDEAGNFQEIEEVVTLDTTLMGLNIDTPNSVTVSKVAITGTTDPDVVFVVVNDAIYPVVDGEFSVPVKLKEGKNTFEVVVIDRAGNSITKEITIKYEKESPGFSAVLLMAALVSVFGLSRIRRREGPI